MKAYKAVFKSRNKLELGYAQFIAIILILILKNGINFFGYDNYAISWAKVWPKPVSHFSVENFGTIALAKFFSIDTRLSWMALHIFLSVLFYVVIFFCLRVNKVLQNQRQTIIFLILVSPLTTIVMQEIGYFDILTLIGSAILALSETTRFKLVGTFVMCAGHTPQALVATFLYALFVYMVKHYKEKFHIKLAFPFVLSLGIWLFEQRWLGTTPGRTTEFDFSAWIVATKGFLISAPLFIYSILGPLWILSYQVYKVLDLKKRLQKYFAFVIFLFFPILFGVITVEATRVTVCLIAPMLIWLIKYLVLELNLSVTSEKKYLLIFLPSFLIWRFGEVVAPWTELKQFFTF